MKGMIQNDTDYLHTYYPVVRRDSGGKTADTGILELAVGAFEPGKAQAQAEICNKNVSKSVQKRRYGLPKRLVLRQNRGIKNRKE